MYWVSAAWYLNDATSDLTSSLKLVKLLAIAAVQKQTTVIHDSH